VIVVDVRTDKYFSGGMIPGAIRLPWSFFRTNDAGANLASTFVGLSKAQDILGDHGITPDDTLVLYDSVERDGGATASYVFWVLDLLGHKNKKILERGINGWKDAGYDLVTTPGEIKPLLYQAGYENLKRHRLIDGNFVYKRLGDPFYQMVDVRSRAEYMGEKGTRGLNGEPLKLGHVPTAVNINYEAAWTDDTSKKIKTFPQLRELYKGLDPSKGIIVYCNSGRRSAFSYYILRLMGFETVYTYEPSWKEWGNPEHFFPVETRENILSGEYLSQPSSRSTSHSKPVEHSSSATGSQPESGYISCGG
jgi:thiosulfate/3-mercaptopyruvate sulfurtransferase